MAEIYSARVRDLLSDAAEHAATGQWDAVKALAAAALSLAPDSADAQRLHAEAEAAGPPDGERRQLTVMFCDVVGSTALSQERDPELLREVLRSYQATCDEVVRRYGARVARYVGDGVLVYFGHPEVHEDDARRAVQAGLDLVAAMRPLSEEIRRRYDVDLQVRVAVHTGLVVRSDMGSAATPDRDAIVGETPNLAARLQDHARPGSLLISDATYELVRGWFLVMPAGALEMKGIDRKVTAYEVLEATPTDSRLEAQADLSPFVGREAQLAELERLWGEVLEGECRSVILSGAPGVGKSRLADVQRRRAEATGGSSLVTACSTLHGSTALHPIRRLIARSSGIQPNADGRHALTRLWTSLDALRMADALPLLADLLDIPPEPWCPAPELEPAKLREALLSTVVDWVRAGAERAPLMLLVDDVQWADPTTMELVGRLVASRISGLLLVMTARSDHPIAWSTPVRLEVERLSVDDLSALARRLPEAKGLSGPQLTAAVERSDGIPLFLEELVRSSALASGDGLPDPSTIPAALRDLLLARFAAPGVDLRLAQLLATIGLESPEPVIRAASDLDPAVLDAQLAALVEVGIVTRSAGPLATYRFHHQLLADLAYDTQLHAVRRRSHGVVADVLRGHDGAPAVLAHHFERADRFAEAISALAEAAEAAQVLGATAEANEVLERAFGLLDRVEGLERLELEFEVRLLRGITAAGTLGYAAPQAITDFQACRELLGEIDGDGYLDEDPDRSRASDERLWATSGLWATFLLQGRLADADEVIQNLARRLRPDGALHSYFTGIVGFGQFFAGDYAAAAGQIDAVLEALDSIVLPARLAVPSDPRAAALAHKAFIEVVRCRFDEAARSSDLALAIARDLPFPRGPFSVCYAAGMRAATELSIGNAEASAAFLGEQVELSERHGFTFWQVVSNYYHSVTAAYDGDAGASMRAEMSVQLLLSLGVEVWLPSFYAALGSAHLRTGNLDEADRFFSSAKDVADRLGTHYWSAEIARQRGVVRMARGDERGMDLVREAVAIAQRQGATLFELWALTTICEHGGDAEDQAALTALVDGIGPAAEGYADIAAARAALGLV